MADKRINRSVTVLLALTSSEVKLRFAPLVHQMFDFENPAFIWHDIKYPQLSLAELIKPTNRVLYRGVRGP